MTASLAPRPRRSVLYMPGSNAKALAKARTLPADAIVFDLEDAVAPAMKATARAQIADAFAAGPFAAETLIRVNAVGTAELDDDLACVARCRPDALLLPKVEDAAQLAAFFASAAVRALPEGIALWAMIETPSGLMELDAIVRAGLAGTPRLACLVVGTNDIAKETGVDPGDGRRWLMPWLMQVVLAAKRHRVAVLDGVWNDFADMAGYEAELAQSVKMGFDGKTLIHPTQIAPANRAFAPAPAALDQARAIVAAFARPEHARAGVINLDGKMVERLHLAQAERLLGLQAAIDARSVGSEPANAGA